MENWEIFESTGLPKKNEEFRKMIFVSDTVGYLFGTNETDENILQKNFHLAKGVVYRTKDAGRNWKKIHTSISRFQDARFTVIIHFLH